MVCMHLLELIAQCYIEPSEVVETTTFEDFDCESPDPLGLHLKHVIGIAS